MNQDILVFVETRDGNISKVGLELLGEANKLNKFNNKVIACLIGYQLEEAVNTLKTKEVDEIYLIDDENFYKYNTLNYASVLFDVIKTINPNILLIGATSIGRDIAPRLSARLNTGLTADCTRLEIDENNKLLSTRPAFGGNVYATIVCANSLPQISTVRPGVMLPVKDSSKEKKVIEFKYNKLPEQSIKLVKEVKDVQKVELIEESKILVSFGRGIGSPENMEKGKELSRLLKGTYSCSRALVDEKRVEQVRQVGQTGKTVKPALYLALGISGAIQHLVGMENSEYIIAVNKDRNAPIFNVADIGVVGDVNQILPLLVKKVHEELENE